MVDNCYGEFVETIEPTDVGADLDSRFSDQNPGWRTGSDRWLYCRKERICRQRSIPPDFSGTGKEVGATLGVNQSFYQGFFLAPTVTAAALKGAIFAANVYERLGFAVVPNSTESRHDIIQAVTFGAPEK